MGRLTDEYLTNLSIRMSQDDFDTPARFSQETLTRGKRPAFASAPKNQRDAAQNMPPSHARCDLRVQRVAVTRQSITLY